MEKLKCTIPKDICNLRDDGGYCILGIGYLCQPIVDQCEKCKRINNGYCSAYINPRLKWSHGKKCPLASHLITIIGEERSKKRIGQQKHGKKDKNY